jgi:hypothetical protein
MLMGKQYIVRCDSTDRTRKDSVVRGSWEVRADSEGRRKIFLRGRRKRNKNRRYGGVQIIRRETADRWEREGRKSPDHRVVISR